MFILDIIVAAASAAAIIFGFIKGIIKQIGYLGAIVIAFYLSLKLFPKGAEFIVAHTSITGKLAAMASFIVIYFILLIFFLLFTFIVSKTAQNTPLAVIDRILGMLFSFAATFLILATLVYSFAMLPLGETVKKNVKSTFTYKSAEYIMNLRKGAVNESRPSAH